MTDYIVSGSDLENIAESIRTKISSRDRITFPTGFITAINNISTGSFELKFFTDQNASEFKNENVVVNTSGVDTTIKEYSNSNINGLWEVGKTVHVVIKDTEGPRAGHFYASETMYPEIQASDTSLSSIARIIYFCDSNGALKSYMTSKAYGIYATSFTKYNTMTIKATYDAVYSRDINGTYNIAIYKTSY